MRGSEQTCLEISHNHQKSSMRLIIVSASAVAETRVTGNNHRTSLNTRFEHAAYQSRGKQHTIGTKKNGTVNVPDPHVLRHLANDEGVLGPGSNSGCSTWQSSKSASVLSVICTSRLTAPPADDLPPHRTELEALYSSAGRNCIFESRGRELVCGYGKVWCFRSPLLRYSYVI